MLMAFVEIAGLVIVLITAIWYIAEGNADFATLTEFRPLAAPARRWRSSRVSRCRSSR